MKNIDEKNIDDMSNKDLEDLYLVGESLNIYNSRASKAKRLLELRHEWHHEELATRAYNKQVEAAEKQKEVAERIINYLDYFKNNWFIKKPWYIQVTIFLIFTVLIGITLNIAATYITTFWFQWR